MPEAVRRQPVSVRGHPRAARPEAFGALALAPSFWQKRLGLPVMPWEATMSVARVTEIISASDQSFEHAVREGIERANQTLENIKEAWVASQRVVVESGKIVEYRVTLKVTFVLR
jgi:dodecin